mgnify:CR=1 FL=1
MKIKEIIINLFKSDETVILNKNGEDIGLRENTNGAIYIKPKIYLKNTKVKNLIEKMSKSNIVKKSII